MIKAKKNSGEFPQLKENSEIITGNPKKIQKYFLEPEKSLGKFLKNSGALKVL